MRRRDARRACHRRGRAAQCRQRRHGQEQRRFLLPELWRGKSKGDLQAVCVPETPGTPNAFGIARPARALYVSANGYFGLHESRAGAVAMALYALGIASPRLGASSAPAAAATAAVTTTGAAE